MNATNVASVFGISSLAMLAIAACDAEDTGGDVRFQPPQCDIGDDTTFRIACADMVDIDRVQLTFTQPLLPPDGVRPEQFRLSAAISDYDSIGGYGYDDPELVFVGTRYSPAAFVTAIEGSKKDPRVLLLDLDQPVSWYDCGWFGNGDGYGRGLPLSGWHVHFASSGVPMGAPLESDRGAEISDISPDWIIGDELPQLVPDELFPGFDNPVPARCFEQLKLALPDGPGGA